MGTRVRARSEPTPEQREACVLREALQCEDLGDGGTVQLSARTVIASLTGPHIATRGDFYLFTRNGRPYRAYERPLTESVKGLGIGQFPTAPVAGQGPTDKPASEQREGYARPDKATYEYAHQAYLEELEGRIAAQMDLMDLQQKFARLQAENYADLLEQMQEAWGNAESIGRCEIDAFLGSRCTHKPTTSLRAEHARLVEENARLTAERDARILPAREREPLTIEDDECE